METGLFFLHFQNSENNFKVIIQLAFIFSSQQGRKKLKLKELHFRKAKLRSGFRACACKYLS